MKMKRTIFNVLQTCGLRFAVCTLVMGFSSFAFAQTDDEDEIDDNNESTVEEGSELAKKTRQELADLDDLDI